MGEVVQLFRRCLCCEGRRKFRAFVDEKHIDIRCALCGGTGQQPPDEVIERWRKERGVQKEA